MDTANKSKERRAQFEAELGKLALEYWRMENNLASLDEKIRLLNGAVQEAQMGERDVDSLLAIVQAQKEAAAGEKPVAKGTPKVEIVPLTGKKN